MNAQEIVFAQCLCLPGFLFDGCRSDVTANEMSEMLVGGVSAKVREYELLCGELPSEEDGLSALVTRPESLAEDAKWMQLYPEVPTDPWGAPVRYFVDEELPQGFGVYVCGRDGITCSRGNDPDDSNNWD
ncbi:type II secretion system protein GspG [Roseibacillus persicicus]|uniref:type II secretion system protein GspG n=1 Tax=Roseibacillus persicicus TaxID=454148 RepID=UPI00398AA8EC